MNRQLRIGLTLIGWMMVVALYFTAIATAIAKAEIPTPPGGGITISVVKYPTRISNGQIVTYGLEVHNLSATKKHVLLVLVVNGNVAPQKGGGYDTLSAVRRIAVPAGKVASVHFRAMMTTELFDSNAQACLTVWANGNVGAFTCAQSVGLK